MVLLLCESLMAEIGILLQFQNGSGCRFSVLACIQQKHL